MTEINNILVLDDNESNVLFFEVLLGEIEKELTVFTATSGSHAEILIEEEQIQFIICAWEMSAMPGTVFVQRIRQDRRRKYLPCLIFSKRMKPEDIAITKELGFDNVIGMPFDKQTVKDRILEMIESEEKLTHPERNLRKVEALISDGKLTEALKLIGPILAKKNENLKIRARIAYGEIWLGSNNFDKAEKAFLQALKDDPENVVAKRFMAKLYSLTGKHDEAISTLEELTKLSPHSIKSKLSLGTAYADADQHDKAKAVFKEVEELDADNSELKDEQGKLAFKEGDFSLAAQLLAETGQGNELARHFNNMAIAHVSSGEYEKGIEIYNNAIQLLSDRARLHQLFYNLGLAFRKKGDLEVAFKNLCESYLADSTFEKAYSALAKVSREMKEQSIELDSFLVNKVKDARSEYKKQKPPDEDIQKS